jgi:hypothetical protein
VVINLVALRGKVLLSFGTGRTVHSSSPRKPRWAGRMHVSRGSGLRHVPGWSASDSKTKPAFALSVPAFRRAATAHSEREPLTLNRHSNYNASSAAARAADV